MSRSSMSTRSLPDLPTLNTRQLTVLLLLSAALLIQNTQPVRVSSQLLIETRHPTEEADKLSNWNAITQMTTSTSTMIQSSQLSSTSYGGSASTTIQPRVTPRAPPNGTWTTFKPQQVPGGYNDRWWIIDYWSNLQATFPHMQSSSQQYQTLLRIGQQAKRFWFCR